MKHTIFKYRWIKQKLNKFTEFGIDFDNNKYGIGICSEIEYSPTDEKRYKGFIKMNPKEIYLRVWVLQYSFSIGIGEIELVKKKRNNFKFLLGVAGQ